MSDTNTSNEVEAIKELARKLDSFMALVPATYITRIEASTQFSNMSEKIADAKDALEALELKYREDYIRNNDEHTSLRDTVVLSERRIIEKIDDNNKTTWGNRLTLILGAFGWILTLGMVIIDLLMRK